MVYGAYEELVTRDYQLTLTSGGPAVRAKVQDFEGEISRGAISEQDLGKKMVALMAQNTSKYQLYKVGPPR